MSTHTAAPRARTFNVFERTIAAKQWGNPDGIPTLALHGWLDNANTFDHLAPLLPELNLVAIDFAGHGLSDHRGVGVHYHSITDIQDVLAVADQLGWQQFNLLGHSMGAAISSELAATFPERVEKAVMIDGFVATGGATDADRRTQNREAIEKMLATPRTPKIFKDVQEMALRVTQATDQSLEAASALVARGHKVLEGGVTWRTDPRIRYPTPLRHTREQLNALIEQTTAACLLIVAEQGDTWYQGEIEDTQAHHKNLTVWRMAGPHHVHLEPLYVDKVAYEVRRFLNLGGADVAEQIEFDGAVENR